MRRILALALVALASHCECKADEVKARVHITKERYGLIQRIRDARAQRVMLVQPTTEVRPARVTSLPTVAAEPAPAPKSKGVRILIEKE